MIEFRTYCGLAGDLQELLIARDSFGKEQHMLIPRTGLFKEYIIRRAKQKLINKLNHKP